MTQPTEQARLAEFIRSRGSVTEAAEALGMDRAYVSTVINGQKPIGDGFRWAFNRAFGPEAAAAVFDDAPEVEKVTVTRYTTRTGTQPAEVRA